MKTCKVEWIQHPNIEGLTLPLILFHSWVLRVELGIGSEECRNSTFKWNVYHLNGKITDKLRERWDSLYEEGSFFLT